MKAFLQDPATGEAVSVEEGSAPRGRRRGGGPPLSIGLISAGWPPDAYLNGLTTYVARAAEGLRTLGHRVTILGTWLGSQPHPCENPR